MADRMNIKFTIQAVDRFTATMKNLERKLDSIQRKANSLDLDRRADIDISTAEATLDLARLQQQINRLERAAAKPKKIKVNARDAEASMRRISDMVTGIGDRRMQINGDNRDAMRSLREIQLTMRQLQDKNQEIRTRVVMDDSSAMKALQRVARRTDAVMNARDNYRLGFNILPATRSLNELRTIADNVTQDRDIDVSVDLAGALARLQVLRAASESLDDSDVDIDVDANTADAHARLAIIEAHRRRVDGSRAVISVLLQGYKRFRTNMDRIATTGRNVGEIVGNTFMGIATTFSTTLVPIIASTTGALGSMGVMIGTTAGATMGLASALVGAGAAGAGFAAVAIPAISKFQLKMKEISELKLAIDAAQAKGDLEEVASLTADLERIQGSLTESQQKAQLHMAELSETYQGLSQAMEPGVLQAYGNSMSGLATIIQMATPMITASVDAVNRLVDAFNRNLNTEDVVAFFSFLNTTGAASLQVIGKALGNFLMGFLNMMVAFGPLASDMQGGFLRMSEGFRAWSAALGDNSKFQAFVSYVRENWPAVRNIIGTAIAAIIETFAGFGSYATTWMAVTQALINKWREFAQGMGDNAKFQAFIDYIRTNGPLVTAMIGDMIQFLVALGVALAPVGSIMVEVASAVFNFLTSMLQANPILGQMLGWIIALAGGFFTLLPIGIAIYSFFSTFVTIIGMVAPKLMGLVKTVFQTMTSFSRLSSAFTTLRIIMMTLGGPVAWIIGILLLLIPVFVQLWQSSETFRTAITNAFNSIKSVVSSAISAVVSFVMSTWGSLVAWWTQNGEMIKQATSNVWNVIGTVIATVMNLISTIMSAIWPVIQMLIVSVWNNIKGVISGALNMIMGLVTIFSALFTGNWSAMWEGVKQLFSGAVQFLWNAVQLLLWGKLLKGVAVFAGMFRTGVTAMWTSIKTAFSTALTSISSTTMAGLTAIRTFFQTGLTAIRMVASNVWNAIRNTFSTALSAITSRVSAGISRVRAVFSTGLNAARSIVSSVLNAIRNFFSSAMSNITSRVTSGLSRIRSAFTSGMNAARSIVTSVLNAIRNFFTSAMSNIVSRVTSGLSRIRSAFQSGMSAARSVVMSALNAIRNFFTTAISAIVSRVTSGLSRMVAAFRSGLDRAKSIVRGAINAIKALFNIDLSAQGRKIVESVARGITGAIGKVTGAIGKVTEKIRNFLPFSPAKEGALRDLDKLNFGGTIAKSISRQTGTVRRAMATAMEAASPNVDYSVDNAYTGAGRAYTNMHADRAKESRTTIEVPVYLHGKEIARASNDEQKRMNAREEARVAQFNRAGGTQ